MGARTYEIAEELQRAAGALQLLLSQSEGKRGDTVIFTGEFAHLRGGSYDDILDDAEAALASLFDQPLTPGSPS